MSAFTPLLPKKRPGSTQLARPSKILKSQTDHDGPSPAARYFLCMWRKPQQKKHKTWEADGVLILDGSRLKLMDKDTSKSIGSSAWKGDALGPGDELSVGGKDVEIEMETTAEEYASGRLFMSMEAVTTQVPVVRPTPTFKNPVLQPKLAATSTKEPSSTLIKKLTQGSSSTKAPRHDPTAKGAVVMKRPDARQEARLNPKGLPLVDVVVDPYIGQHLRPHQVEGVQFMYECVMGMRSEGQGAILADEMGLGKTIQAISLAWTLLRQNPFAGQGPAVSRVLVACPVTLVKSWAREFKKWLGQDKVRVFAASAKADLKSFCASKVFEVLVIGYERLRLVIDDLKKAQPPFGLIICDEGHRLKSAGTKTVQALKALTTTRRVILSGTPIQNDLSEFHAMADWVNPGLLETYSTFKKIYEVPILRAREQNSTKANKELGNARNDQLARVSQTFVLRRTAEILHGYLPPKHEHCVFVLPTELQQNLFRQLLGEQRVGQITKPSANNSSYLGILSMLYKISNSPGLLVKKLSKGNATPELQELAQCMPANTVPGDVKLSGKLLLLSAMLKQLKNATDDKIVVVSNFTQTLDLIEEHCQAQAYPFVRLDGSTAQNKRQELVDQFNRSPQTKTFVFLLSSKSGGSGLNLIGANRLVLFDMDWNPSVDLQAMARIHRDGQKKICHIYRFITAGTIDEKIFQRQIIKTTLAGALTGGNKGKEDAFTAEELKAIFTFHPNTGCHTHDLLGCRCIEGDAVSEDSQDESEDEAPRKSFVKASGYEPHVSKERKKLAALKDWVHVPADKANATDDVSDSVLQQLVRDGVTKMIKVTDRSTSQDSDNDVQKDYSKAGGCVSFVFTRVSGGIALEGA